MIIKQLDRDGLFYLIFLFVSEIKDQNKTISELQSKIEELEHRAILDSGDFESLDK